MEKPLKIKIFVSALPDNEREAKSLLKIMDDFNNSRNGFKNPNEVELLLYGNNYIFSLLDEQNKYLKSSDIPHSVDNFPMDYNHEEDIFVGLVWNSIENTNFIDINLKNDLCNAYKILDVMGGSLYSLFYFSFREASLFDKINVKEIKKADKLKKYLKDKVFHETYDSVEEFEYKFRIDIATVVGQIAGEFDNNNYGNDVNKKSNISNNKNSDSQPKTFADLALNMYKSAHNLPEDISDEELSKHMDEHLNFDDDFNNGGVLELDQNSFDAIREDIISSSIELTEFENKYEFLENNKLFNQYDYNMAVCHENYKIIKQLISNSNDKNTGINNASELNNVILELKERLKFTIANNFIFTLICFFNNLEYDAKDFARYLTDLYEDDKDFSVFLKNDSNINELITEYGEYLENWDLEYNNFKVVVLKKLDFHLNLISLFDYFLYEENYDKNEEDETDVYNLIQLLLYLNFQIDKALDNLDFLAYKNNELSGIDNEDIINQYNKLRKFINKWIRNIKIVEKGIKTLLEEIN